MRPTGDLPGSRVAVATQDVSQCVMKSMRTLTCAPRPRPFFENERDFLAAGHVNPDEQAAVAQRSRLSIRDVAGFSGVGCTAPRLPLAKLGFCGMLIA
jgi:hypothetical protein